MQSGILSEMAMFSPTNALWIAFHKLVNGVRLELHLFLSEIRSCGNKSAHRIQLPLIDSNAF
jgi:hypothetical protein